MRTSPVRRVLTTALILAAAVPFMASCNKQKPTTAVISVRYLDGTPASEDYVRLFANPPVPLGDQTRLNKEGFTNGSGQITFDYTDFYEKGQSGFAIMDIESSKDGLVGKGLIKIEEEKANEETVYLNTP